MQCSIVSQLRRAITVALLLHLLPKVQGMHACPIGSNSFQNLMVHNPAAPMNSYATAMSAQMLTVLTHLQADEEA